MGVDISSIDRFSPPDLKSVFKVIINCFKNGIKTPFKITLSVVGMILIFTLINCLIAINAAEIVVNTTHGDKKIFEFDKNLSEITLSNLIVESITGLEQFTNLQKLHFHHVNFMFFI